MITFPALPLPEEPMLRDMTMIGVLLWWDELSWEQKLWVFRTAHLHVNTPE